MSILDIEKRNKFAEIEKDAHDERYDPDGMKAFWLGMRASARIKTGKIRHAQRDCEEALRYDESNLACRVLLSIIFGAKDEWSKSLNTVATTPPKALADSDLSSQCMFYKQIGTVNLKIGNLREAVHYLAKAIALASRPEILDDARRFKDHGLDINLENLAYTDELPEMQTLLTSATEALALIKYQAELDPDFLAHHLNSGFKDIPLGIWSSYKSLHGDSEENSLVAAQIANYLMGDPIDERRVYAYSLSETDIKRMAHSFAESNPTRLNAIVYNVVINARVHLKKSGGDYLNSDSWNGSKIILKRYGKIVPDRLDIEEYRKIVTLFVKTA